jgi:uncharacterized MAPEG superfamily protein
MEMSILAPAAVLVLWSLVMLGWLAFARFSAAAKLGNKDPVPPGIRGQDIDPKLPPSAAWKSHNYTHLMEQPTLFYATVFILFLSGAATPLLVMFAWAYVILRIIHSVYQATVNVVMVRFAIFMLSTLCLLFLAVHAVLATI